MELKVTKIGNSMGVIMPRELIARLHLEKGDSLFISETPGGFLVTPHDPEFAEQMKAARELMRKRRNVVNELGR